MEIKYDMYYDKLVKLNCPSDKLEKYTNHNQKDIEEMEQEYNKLHNNNQNFDKDEFKEILRKYQKATKDKKYNSESAREEFKNDYIKAYYTLNVKTLYATLQSDVFGYTSEELDRFIVKENDDKMKKTYSNLIDEIQRVQRELDEAKKDPNLQRLLKKINDRRESGVYTMDYLFKKHNHKKSDVEYFLLINEYNHTRVPNMTETDIQNKFPLANDTSIEKMNKEIKKYEQRFLNYSQNGEYQDALSKLKNTKSFDEITRGLVNKYFEIKDDADSLTSALRSLKNDRLIKELGEKNEKIGQGKISFNENEDDEDREKSLEEMKKKLKDLETKFTSK